MKVYILAAGYATRMYPLTRDVPKALLEVAGAPVLTHVVRRLRALEGVSEAVLVSNDRFFERFAAWAEELEPWVPLTLLNDGTGSAEERLGALGDLAFALERVPPGEEDALVLASDHLFDFDLRAVQRAFEARRRTTLLVRRVEREGGPSPYSEVTLDEEGTVLRFREKPERPESDLSAIALYFFPSEDLALLAEYLDEGNPDAPGHFLAWLSERRPCQGVRLTGPWYDIGSLERLEEARRRFTT